MIFYKGNRADAPFEPNLDKVAAEFWASPQGRRHVEDPDFGWPMDRSLHDFLTDPGGFNASWVDNDGYWKLHTKVRETWPEDTGPVVEETEPCLICGEPTVPVGQGPLCKSCEAGQEAEGAQ